MVSAMLRGGAVAVLLLAGCSQTPRTEVILAVDTDLRGPGGIDNFRIDVISPEGDIQSATAMVADGALPRTLGLVHDTGRLGPFTATVEGRTGASPRVARTVRFSFQEGRTLLVEIDLLGACERVSCPSGQTCAGGSCRSVDLAPEELVEWTGTPPPLDVDAQVPPIDGGPGDDAGTPPTDSGMRMDGGPPPVDAGCGADLATDPANCGACGHACDFQHATGSCTAGACTITACDTGFDDCNGVGDDGCEADLMTANATCGSCGTRCTGRDTCCMGTCQRMCP